MEIKKAKKKDARKISLLRRETLKRIVSKDYSERLIKIMLEKYNLKNTLNSIEEENFFCLWNDNNLIGTASLKNNVVSGVYIKFNQIGKGYGKNLMDFIENYSKKRKIKKLVLFSTIGAEKFYEGLGYKKLKGIFIETWKGEKINDLKMEKKLK